MNIKLERDSYEKLIRQIVYIEENIDDIAQKAEGANLFPTQKRARWYFEEYIKEVESLFLCAEVMVYGTKCDIYVNKLPFIVLGSSFTLIDSKKRVRFCHMAYDEQSVCKEAENRIYFLSAAGRALLLKCAGQQVKADIGGGLALFTVNTINIA